MLEGHNFLFLFSSSLDLILYFFIFKHFFFHFSILFQYNLFPKLIFGYLRCSFFIQICSLNLQLQFFQLIWFSTNLVNFSLLLFSMHFHPCHFSCQLIFHLRALTSLELLLFLISHWIFEFVLLRLCGIKSCLSKRSHKI